jgi:hypothetical protein
VDILSIIPTTYLITVNFIELGLEAGGRGGRGMFLAYQ